MRWSIVVASFVLTGCRPAPEGSVAPSAPSSTTAVRGPHDAGASPTDAPPVEASDHEPESVDAGIDPNAAPPTAPARLDKNSIRTEIRAHLPQIRWCYNQGLARDPNLTGRVEVRFTIAPDGSVAESIVANTTLPEEHAEVAECVALVVTRCTFVAPPSGGNAVVTYPFVLEPGHEVTSTGDPSAGPRVAGRWFPSIDVDPNTVVVEVVDADNQPVAGAEVTLTLMFNDRNEQRNVKTGTDGRAVFSDVPPDAQIKAATRTIRSESAALDGRAMQTVLQLPR